MYQNISLAWRYLYSFSFDAGISACWEQRNTKRKCLILIMARAFSSLTKEHCPNYLSLSSQFICPYLSIPPFNIVLFMPEQHLLVTLVRGGLSRKIKLYLFFSHVHNDPQIVHYFCTRFYTVLLKLRTRTDFISWAAMLYLRAVRENPLHRQW